MMVSILIPVLTYKCYKGVLKINTVTFKGIGIFRHNEHYLLGQQNMTHNVAT